MYLTQSDFQIGIFFLFSIFALATALFIVNSKNVFYSAVSLAFLGISVAVLIADLDPEAYSLYSAFHLLRGVPLDLSGNVQGARGQGN